MKLSNEQQKVYDQILKFFKLHKNMSEYRVLSGFSGVGKSTVISKLIDALKSSGKNVMVMAYTGRAVSVLKNKGISDARTIHMSIYYPVIFNGNLIRFDKKINNPEKRIELDNTDYFIIDECSMINEQMHLDLMELEKPVLYVGDQFQLPPISNNKFEKPFNLFDKIDFQLEHIHRQALDNPIIALSKIIRETGKLDKSLADKNHLIFIDRSALFSSSHLKSTNYDILLCGMNKTRHKLNNKFRMIYNYNKSYAQINEPIICLRNKVLNNHMFYNGERFKVMNIKSLDQLKILSDTAKKYNVIEDSKIREYCLKSLDDNINNNLYTVNIADNSWNEQESKQKNLLYATFAYALTVHKSQGSEFAHVGFINENVDQFLSQKAFMYTACTRAQNKLTIYT